MISLVLYLSLFSGPAVDPELEKAVRTFWDLLQKGDKVGALRYVAPEGQNPFLNRRTDPFHSWELDRIELRNAGEALVTVKLEQLLMPAGVYYPVPRREVWVRQPDGWQLRIQPLDMEKLKRAFVGGAASKQRAPKPGVLEMVPKQIKIHFLDRTQRGAVRVRNGLSETVHLSRIDYDKTRFELLDSGGSVAPGQDLRLLFRYIGKEDEKYLRSEVRLLLKRENESRERLVAVPILYNYVSPGARNLMGLSGERLKNLKRGEAVKPVISIPASPPPLPGLPPGVKETDNR